MFEKKTRLTGNVYKLGIPVWYIEESAISKRQEGKVNLCGMKLEDINYLIDHNLVKKEDIVYGWNGTSERTEKSYGTKYKRFY